MAPAARTDDERGSSGRAGNDESDSPTALTPHVSTNSRFLRLDERTCPRLLGGRTMKS